MASPDGHRWALAVGTLWSGVMPWVARICTCGSLETIVLVDLFKERSGLTSTDALIACALPGWDCSAITEALAQLQEWSLVIHRKFSDSYSIFEGSDFDVDDAVGRVLETMDVVDFARLNAIAGLHPVVAKRHYHETGAMRWYGVAIAPLADVQSEPEKHRPHSGGVGTFLLAVPTQNEAPEEACLLARQVVDQVQDWDLGCWAAPGIPGILCPWPGSCWLPSGSGMKLPSCRGTG